ncbi:MAG: pyrroline-5-carboxylate reductase [Clostridia bacterium]|nr:pyrroline-5-carboxylate reductase [Clostridia bacterium]
MSQNANFFENKTISFLGMGNMAQAIVSGFVSSGRIRKEQLYAYAPTREKLEKNAGVFGFSPCLTASEAVRAADYIIIACKPVQIEGLLQPLRGELKGKAVLSIALGWNLERYRALLGGDVRVQFVMPNTPAMVKEGIFLFEKDSTFAPDERAAFLELFGHLGLVEELPSSLMGIGGALTGCGPAFVDMMIEAYADAAVSQGIPRALAIRLTSQMVLGSAKLQLETGKHPAVLKDEVCSPGGSTIRGVMALEEYRYRAACEAAILSAASKK